MTEPAVADPPTVPQRVVPGASYPPLRRSRDGRLLAGVCAGVAEHLGTRVLWVRIAFAALCVGGGAGLLAYALLWVFVRQSAGSGRVATPRERQQGFAVLLLGAGALVGIGAVLSLPAWVTAPLVAALLGVVLVWQEADESQRVRLRAGARSGVAGTLFARGDKAWVRVAAGSALVALGIVLLVGSTTSIEDVPTGLLAAGATLVGVAVLTVPWWVRLVGDLNTERASRIRSQERAEIAAHLHDSVLQTLALIQKQAGAEKEVRRLARGQERELRTWLYGPGGYGSPRDGAAREDAASGPEGTAPSTFAAQLAEICGEVEDHFAINVQPVVVGDCELDERLHAQLAAAREALVNAAKHAGVSEVSLYAEVEPEQVSIFVRDRGAGFETSEVPDDRHGLTDSIHGRMRRHGGQAAVRTSPGSGTEVAMEMPRAAG